MTIAIDCRGVSKRYGLAQVVSDADLQIPEGTVHSLVGANGAGKSTLLGMMSGRVAPTAGEVRIFDRLLRAGRPSDARAAGLTAVYQELTVLPQLTCAANVFLGQEETRAGFLSTRAMNARFDELCAEFSLDLRADQSAGELSVAQAQMLEILRAVQADSRVLLLDEPTAALSERERLQFLDLVRTLRDRGTTMVLVTHNLGEVLSVSDDITVMRSGRIVARGPASEWTRETLVEAMTGEQSSAAHVYRTVDRGDVILEATGVTVPGAISDVSVSVREGEVVGLAGLVGSGRTTLLRALAGAEPRSTGELKLRGRAVSWSRNVRRSIQRGIGLIPEDRKTQGLVLGMTIPDNVTMTDLSAVSSAGIVSPRKQLGRAKELLHALAVSREPGHYPVGWLSGGNQQKVAVAKWLHEDPDVLLVDEPTRGIDVAAKVDVLHAIREVANSGKAVIMTSSEIDEVLEISDRVIVMVEGEAVAEYDMRAGKPSVKDILDLAFRVKEEA